MDLGFDVVVTVTGIVLVFLILVLLMAIITLEGKIFDGLGKKKAAAKAAASKPAAPAKPAAPVQQAAAPAPQVEEGIPGDVVAANGQWQVHPQGGAPRHQRLGQGRRERHHGPVLTQEEEHDTVY